MNEQYLKVLFFFIEIDQDSKLPLGYVKQILSTYYLLVNNNIPVAGVGPIARSKEQNFVYGNHKRKSGIEFVGATLSSGFLYSKSAYQLVGEKDESLFIDYVDWDWCWRANQLGLKVAIDLSVEIEHMLGDGHKNIFGFNVGIPSPVRLYYQYRNSLYIMQRDYISFSWKLKRILILTLKVPFFAFFSDRKKERLKYIIKGVAGFLKQEKGRLNASVE